MSIEIRLLQQGDEDVLASVDPDVFDDPIDAESTLKFLSDRSHYLVVALDGALVVGFASGVHYFHPDKPSPELFVNEVAVASSHQGLGIAKRIMARLFEAGRETGCRQAWVLTERQNAAAMRLYKAAGGEEDPGDTVMFNFPLPSGTEPEAS